jgi:methionine sulfoxide reductase heme-binding subunit
MPVGFSVLVSLIPLAVTSTDGMMRRLGGRRWRQLHRLVYAAAIGGVVHYWWLVKKDISDPALFACRLAVLLGYRLIHAARTRARDRWREMLPPPIACHTALETREQP